MFLFGTSILPPAALTLASCLRLQFQFDVNGTLVSFLRVNPECFALSSCCSIVGKKARALYACKAEHVSELSFIAGTIFENGESGFELWRCEGPSKSSNHPNSFLFCSFFFIPSRVLVVREAALMGLLAGIYSKVNSLEAHARASVFQRSKFSRSCGGHA